MNKSTHNKIDAIRDALNANVVSRHDAVAIAKDVLKASGVNGDAYELLGCGATPTESPMVGVDNVRVVVE